MVYASDEHSLANCASKSVFAVVVATSGNLLDIIGPDEDLIFEFICPLSKNNGTVSLVVKSLIKKSSVKIVVPVYIPALARFVLLLSQRRILFIL